jgi:hypothetical protein
MLCEEAMQTSRHLSHVFRPSVGKGGALKVTRKGEKPLMHVLFCSCRCVIMDEPKLDVDRIMAWSKARLDPALCTIIIAALKQTWGEPSLPVWHAIGNSLPTQEPFAQFNVRGRFFLFSSFASLLKNPDSAKAVRWKSWCFCSRRLAEPKVSHHTAGQRLETLRTN